MAIPKGHKKNFQTLLDAAKLDHLALMECTDKETGKPVQAVRAVYVDDDEQYNFVPIARMFDGNPYEQLIPPTQEA